MTKTHTNPLIPSCMLSGEAVNTNCIALVWLDQGFNPLSTGLDASTLTIWKLHHSWCYDENEHILSSTITLPAGTSTLFQRWPSTLKRRWILVGFESWMDVEKWRWINVTYQRWTNVDATLIQRWIKSMLMQGSICGTEPLWPSPVPSFSIEN